MTGRAFIGSGVPAWLKSSSVAGEFGDGQKKKTPHRYVDFEWTPEARQRLAELWASDLSAGKIAELMNTSKNAIVGKAHRMNLPPRPSPIGPKNPDSKTARRHEAWERQRQSRQVVEQIVAVRPVDAPPAKPVVQRKRTCLYTWGNPGEYVCCEATAVPGSLWCSEHRERCVVTLKPVENELAAVL